MNIGRLLILICILALMIINGCKDSIITEPSYSCLEEELLEDANSNALQVNLTDTSIHDVFAHLKSSNPVYDDCGFAQIYFKISYNIHAVKVDFLLPANLFDYRKMNGICCKFGLPINLSVNKSGDAFINDSFIGNSTALQYHLLNNRIYSDYDQPIIDFMWEDSLSAVQIQSYLLAIQRAYLQRASAYLVKEGFATDLCSLSAFANKYLQKRFRPIITINMERTQLKQIDSIILIAPLIIDELE